MVRLLSLSGAAGNDGSTGVQRNAAHWPAAGGGREKGITNRTWLKDSPGDRESK